MLAGRRTYVGFGFGAIQSGLFLYEAYASGHFRRLVVAEVLPDVVATVRAAGGFYACNIAHADHIETATVGPVQVEDPARPQDRGRLIAAIAEAEEIGTAIPSVGFYASAGPGSLHRILAQGLRRKAAQGGPRAVIYTAENHNHAAEILQEHVLGEIPVAERDLVQSQVRFLNTVIGKMSGIVDDAGQIREQGLAPITPQADRAFLVEAFNRILISRIQFDEGDSPFARGIDVFEEKADLLPFEEAKLYGHNATHALAAYISAFMGIETIAQLRDAPGVLPFLRAAFIDESGAALVRKYNGLDPLFTPAGYQAYADDLLQRMTNPYLRDTVARVGRAPARKLGWDDRLIGTMRLALSQGITPRRYALGAAAALVALDPAIRSHSEIAERLLGLWERASPEPAQAEQVLTLVTVAMQRLEQWQQAGFAAEKLA